MYTWADIKGNMGAWIWRTRALTLHLWLEVGFLTEKQEIKFLCSTPNKGHCCDLSHPRGYPEKGDNQITSDRVFIIRRDKNAVTLTHDENSRHYHPQLKELLPLSQGRCLTGCHPHSASPSSRSWNSAVLRSVHTSASLYFLLITPNALLTSIPCPLKLCLLPKFAQGQLTALL